MNKYAQPSAVRSGRGAVRSRTNKRERRCIFQSKHLAPFSEAARRARRVESSRLTCNFSHGAEDVEPLRVHRSDTVVHIPVGDIETHAETIFILTQGVINLQSSRYKHRERKNPVLFPAVCREKIHNCISLRPWSFKVLGWMNGMERAAH